MSIGAPVRLSERLMVIVESFLAQPHQTLSEVAAACGMDRSTSMRYLRQLVERGWLERDARTRTYTLGARMIEIGQAARSERPLRQTLLPQMQALALRFDETVNLAVYQAGAVVIIEVVESRRSIRRGAVLGGRDDLFSSGLGKAILAHLDEREVLKLLEDHPPIRHTPHTLVDHQEILDEFVRIRVRGYALDLEEAEIGLKCVAVPIRDDHGRYTHAISISGPTARIDERLDGIISALCTVAAATKRGHHGDSA